MELLCREERLPKDWRSGAPRDATSFVQDIRCINWGYRCSHRRNFRFRAGRSWWTRCDDAGHFQRGISLDWVVAVVRGRDDLNAGTSLPVLEYSGDWIERSWIVHWIIECSETKAYATHCCMPLWYLPQVIANRFPGYWFWVLWMNRWVMWKKWQRPEWFSSSIFWVVEVQSSTKNGQRDNGSGAFNHSTTTAPSHLPPFLLWLVVHYSWALRCEIDTVGLRVRAPAHKTANTDWSQSHHSEFLRSERLQIGARAQQQSICFCLSHRKAREVLTLCFCCFCGTLHTDIPVGWWACQDAGEEESVRAGREVLGRRQQNQRPWLRRPDHDRGVWPGASHLHMPFRQLGWFQGTWVCGAVWGQFERPPGGAGSWNGQSVFHSRGRGLSLRNLLVQLLFSASVTICLKIWTVDHVENCRGLRKRMDWEFSATTSLALRCRLSVSNCRVTANIDLVVSNEKQQFMLGIKRHQNRPCPWWLGTLRYAMIVNIMLCMVRRWRYIAYSC